MVLLSIFGQYIILACRRGRKKEVRVCFSCILSNISQLYDFNYCFKLFHAIPHLQSVPHTQIRATCMSGRYEGHAVVHVR